MGTATRSAARPRWPLALLAAAAFVVAAGWGAGTPLGRAWVARLSVAGNVAATPEAPPAAPLPPRALLVVSGYLDVEGGDRKLGPGIAGIVSEVVAPEGALVAEGAPLLKLRDNAAEEDVALATATLAQAEKRLTIARKGAPLRDSRVTEQEQAVNAAQLTVQEAENNYRRLSNLEAENQTERALDNLRRTIDKAKANLEAQRQRLTQLGLDDPEDSVALAASEVAKAGAALAKAREYRGQHVLRAPEAGRVLRVFVGKGAAVAPGAGPALVFLPDRPPIVRCEIGQEYSRRIVEGLPVEVRPDALDGPAWAGRILRVAAWVGPRRSMLDEPLERNDVRTLECIVAFAARPAGVRHGERVRIVVSAAAKSSVVEAVPAVAADAKAKTNN